MEPLQVRPGVVVPVEAMTMRAVRSSGPGGQNVNKVASKVELRVDLRRIAGLDAAQLARLFTMCASRLDADGLLLVTSERTREQPRNLADAMEKVRALVLAALTVPRKRRPTRRTRGSVERRLGDKRVRGERKLSRRSPKE
jgi:ribosome-associated protein